MRRDCFGTICSLLAIAFVLQCLEILPSTLHAFSFPTVVPRTVSSKMILSMERLSLIRLHLQPDRTIKLNYNCDDDYDDESHHSDDSAVVPSSLAGRTNIFGERYVSCRQFSLSSEKSISELGKFTVGAAMPEYNLPEIAFIGRSNVGKSSVLNSLMRSKKTIARTSKTPGCTRTIRPYKIADSQGDIGIFLDLPGYGFANLPSEVQQRAGKMLRDVILHRKSLRLVCLLLDVRRILDSSTSPPTKVGCSTLKHKHKQQCVSELDMDILRVIEEEGLPCIILCTKCDTVNMKPLKEIASSNTTLIAQSNKKQQVISLLRKSIPFLSSFPTKDPIFYSAENGLGKQELWTALRDGISTDGTQNPHILIPD